MPKILLIGCCGTGKTTLSLKLGELYNIPVIHSDMHFWNVGWVPSSKKEWHEKVKQLSASENWIMDGFFSSTANILIPIADEIIFIDRSRLFCLKNILKRTWYHWDKVRPDMAEGCPENSSFMRLNLLQWIWFYPKRIKPKIFNFIDEYNAHHKFKVLKNDQEVDVYCKSIIK